MRVGPNGFKIVASAPRSPILLIDFRIVYVGFRIVEEEEEKEEEECNKSSFRLKSNELAVTFDETTHFRCKK